MKSAIPTHHFIYDDETSIPFRLETLDHKNSYDIDTPHRHNYYEIFLFNKGGGTHVIDFRSLNIEDHSIHFISPGQAHQVNRSLNSDGFVIMFSREFTHAGSDNKDLLYQLPYFHNFTKKPTIEPKENDYLNILNIFKDLQSEFEANQLFNSEILQSYLNILLLKCRRLFVANNESQQDTASQLPLQKFIRVLEKHYGKFHQVQDYAQLMELTPQQLNDITKSTMGKTASEMIQERIILEAKRLLLHTGMSAKEIAYALNFSDPAYFSRFFKNQTSYTPNEFKKVGLSKYKS